MTPSQTKHARSARWGSTTAALQLAAVLALTAAAFTAQAGVEEGRAKAQVCAACHGADGNSSMPMMPSLAGQPKQFIVTALFMFREGRRNNAMMTPFADKLSNADLNDLAAYFAAQKMTPPTRKASEDTIARARAVTEKNNCVACHTASLVGQQHIPRLAGQHKEYLLEQLKGFKAATRADFDGTMTSAAQGLAVNELEMLADYLSTLSAP
jgi:cytochrome c553